MCAYKLQYMYKYTNVLLYVLLYMHGPTNSVFARNCLSSNCSSSPLRGRARCAPNRTCHPPLSTLWSCTSTGRPLEITGVLRECVSEKERDSERER